jgi:hypothetical protein
MPDRIQRRRVAGWRLPENATIIDRSSRWGNPFRIADAAEEGYADPRRACVEMYHAWLHGAGPDVYLVGARCFDRQWVWDHLLDLEGRDVACTCPLPDPGDPDFCHGQPLLAAVEAAVARRARRRAAAGGCAPCELSSLRSLRDIQLKGELL